MTEPPRVRDPSLREDAHALRAATASFATLGELHASPQWPELERRLTALLGGVRSHPAPAAPLEHAVLGVAPVQPSRDGVAAGHRVHVVHWNVEHGNRFEAIATALRSHPELAGADVVTLNEVDLGMARSGNRDVAGELAERLGMHGAWAAMFLEGTRGRDDDALTAVPGDNDESLFGLAILSRWPLARPRLVPLPGPEATLFGRERMLGRFVALVCDVLHPVQPFVTATVHLEVHRTRVHRAEQMRRLLAALAAESAPVLLTGDWNTHTFDRGTALAVPSAAWTLLASPSASLSRRLTRPDRGAAAEGLFDHLRASGFEWEHCNDDAPTLSMRFSRLGEVHALPPPLRAWVARGLTWAERRARLRLDWIAVRGFQAEPGAARTVRGLDGPGLASDHAPVTADLSLGTFATGA